MSHKRHPTMLADVWDQNWGLWFALAVDAEQAELAETALRALLAKTIFPPAWRFS
jgi:hypothetical protein